MIKVQVWMDRQTAVRHIFATNLIQSMCGLNAARTGDRFIFHGLPADCEQCRQACSELIATLQAYMTPTIVDYSNDEHHLPSKEIRTGLNPTW